MRRFIVMLVILGIAFAALPSVPARAQDVTSYLLNRINELRASRGLNTLTINAQLTAAAQAHSQYLASTAYIHPHRERDGSLPQDRAARAGYAGRVGENVVGGTSASVEWAFNWWMQSGIHLNNMLGNWTEIGIGFADGGQYGRWYTTVFGHSGREPRQDEGFAIVPGMPAQAVAAAAPAGPPRPTQPPPPTFTPSPTLTPSQTYTPRPTMTPTFTGTPLPPTETPIVLEISPQPGFTLTAAPDQLPTVLPTETAAPLAVALAASAPPEEPPDTTVAPPPSPPSARDFIPWAIALQAVVVGGLVAGAVFRSVFRRRR